MKPQPPFDIDFDKHNNASVRIVCAACGHENAHSLKTLTPDNDIFCSQCQANITLDLEGIQLAQQQAAQIRRAYDGS